jgi:tRNA (adenine57-N1/adenine58-N1)-methyltransferase
MPDSDRAVPNAFKSLKRGGHIFGYLPHIEQVKKFVKALNRQKFADVYIYEVIVRDILTRKEGTRHSTSGVWHTAYLVFGRKPD